MNTKQLGNTSLNISRIGIGAWAMGGKWEFGWGQQQDKDSIATIQHALSKGVNWIDTAPVYGLGHSEQVVGQAIKGMSEKPLIFTKCCFRWDDKQNITPDLSAASVREELENSLKRLAVEAIDLYQIHWPNPEAQIEEGWDTMRALQQEGKIRYLGVSNHSVEQMDKLAAIAPVNSLQPNYSLINRECEQAQLPYCQDNDIGVICYSPMGSGLLTGKMTRERIANLAEDDWRRGSDEFQEPKLSRNLAIVEALKAVGARHGVSAAEVSIAWVLKHQAVTAAIVGMRSPEQVNGVVGGAAIELDEQDLALISTASA